MAGTVKTNPTATEAAAAAPEPMRDIPGITRPMTYAEYLASPEEMARYDILDGWKIYRKYGEEGLRNPTRIHQRVAQRITRFFEDYETRTGAGQAIIGPCDVVVSSSPARTRQPDVLFISKERLAQNPPPSTAAPLSSAPELVVEILSPSDTRRVKQDKIADYCAVDVKECWLVSAEAETVEVLRLSPDGWVTAAIYGQGQTVASLFFEGLTVAVDNIFAV